MTSLLELPQIWSTWTSKRGQNCTPTLGHQEPFWGTVHMWEPGAGDDVLVQQVPAAAAIGGLGCTHGEPKLRACRTIAKVVLNKYIRLWILAIESKERGTLQACGGHVPILFSQWDELRHIQWRQMFTCFRLQSPCPTAPYCCSSLGFF